MNPAVPINRLGLLVRQPPPLADLDRHDPFALVIDRFALPGHQIRYDLSVPVFPGPPSVLAECITDVMIILGPVGPGLLFVFCIVRVVPSFVVDEASVYPGDVELAASVVEPVNVRVRFEARQVLAEVLVRAALGWGVNVEVVVAQACFAISEGEEKGGVQGEETRVGDVVEGLVG